MNQVKLPLVSIVMLSYNRRKEVLDGLLEIEKIQYQNLEIIVVDNASQDGTGAAVSALHPEVVLISLEKNIGVAAANQGFFSARGEYIIIIDDDSFPLPDSVSRMVERFESDPTIGIVAFHVRNVSHFHQPDSGKKLEKTENSDYRLGFNGAGAGFRRAALEECGGYSDHFFLYWNELDLALRFLHKGYSICRDEQIIALHHYSPRNRSSLRAPYFYTRNLLWLYWQYWPLSCLLPRIFSFLSSCIYHSIEQANLVYVKAFFSGLLGLGQLKRTPMDKTLIKSLRLTEKLSFIYFR